MEPRGERRPDVYVRNTPRQAPFAGRHTVHENWMHYQLVCNDGRRPGGPASELVLKTEPRRTNASRMRKSCSPSVRPDSIVEVLAMNIADFTKQEVHAIVDEWVEFARTTVPAAQEFSREDLADHAKVLLLAIAADITDSQGAQARHDKSQGNRPETAPEITRVARHHAAQRFQQGFSFDQLVAEFRALQASVIRRWAKQVQQVRAEEVDELTRFGEARLSPPPRPSTPERSTTRATSCLVCWGTTCERR